VRPQTKTAMSTNNTQIYTVRNETIFQHVVEDEPLITIREAVIYIQSLTDGIFDLPINANAPLIAINRNNTYNFNLQAILQDNPHFQSVACPNLQSPIVRELNNFTLNYQVFTNIVGKTETTKSEIFCGINAKLTRRIWNNFGQNYFTQYPADYVRFLQGGPRNRIVSSSSPSFLYFLFNQNLCPEGVAIIVKFHDADFSLISSENFYEIHGIKENKVYQMNVSLDKMLDITPDNFMYYSVALHLVDEAGGIGEQYSEKFLYYLDESLYDTPERNIYFKNHFGVWDTFRITEAVTFTSDHTREVFVNENLETMDNSIERAVKLTFSTGDLAQYWLQYLDEELCSSKEIYYVDESETFRLKCTTQGIEDNSYNAREQAVLEFDIARKIQY
jgi:hypothetical protein